MTGGIDNIKKALANWRSYERWENESVVMSELEYEIIDGLTKGMSIENMVEFREVFNKEDK